MATLLGMFAKFWAPGAVKTRLAASLGPARAAEVHRLFVETLAARFARCGDRRAILFAPAESEAAFGGVVGDRWQRIAQVEGDLGRRMQSFFEHSVETSERVALIGSDSPDLPREY